MEQAHASRRGRGLRALLLMHQPNRSGVIRHFGRPEAGLSVRVEHSNRNARKFNIYNGLSFALQGDEKLLFNVVWRGFDTGLALVRRLLSSLTSRHVFSNGWPR
jgi:hypothetical protein